MSGYEISILKFSWAMKSQLHAFILQKEVWSESEISLNWTNYPNSFAANRLP